MQALTCSQRLGSRTSDCRSHSGSSAQGPTFQRRWASSPQAQPTSRAPSAVPARSSGELGAIAALSGCSVIKPWYMSIDEEAEDVVGIAVTSYANISTPLSHPQHAAVGYRTPLKAPRERPEGLRLGDMESMQAWIAPATSSDRQRYERIRQFVEQNAVKPLAGSIDTWSNTRQPAAAAAAGWIMSFDEEAMGSFEEGVLGSV